MDWQRLVQITMEELDRAKEASSCIMAASVLLRLLHLKEINGAYPLTVKPRILNPRLTARLEREPSLDIPQLMNDMNELNSSEYAIIAIGHGEGSSTQWSGHLVVVIPKTLKGKDAICDLTIAQANKPEWGIQLGPLLVGVRESFLNGTEPMQVTIKECRVIYKAFPDDTSFKQAPVWNQKSRRNQIVEQILKQL